MKLSQVINLNECTTNNADQVMAVDGEAVIYDTTGTTPSVHTAQDVMDLDDGDDKDVDVFLYDLTEDTYSVVVSTTMTYRKLAGFWTIPLVDFSAVLENRHKYVGSVEDTTGDTYPFRDFKIQEFTVDNDEAEDILYRLGYRIDVSSSPAYIYYYKSGSPNVDVYKAPVYEDDAGTISATRADRIVCRGPIEPI